MKLGNKYRFHFRISPSFFFQIFLKKNFNPTKKLEKKRFVLAIHSKRKFVEKEVENIKKWNKFHRIWLKKCQFCGFSFHFLLLLLWWRWWWVHHRSSVYNYFFLNLIWECCDSNAFSWIGNKKKKADTIGPSWINNSYNSSAN